MRTLYYNDFDTTIDGSHLVLASGNGQVVHSGNALRVVCPSGIDCTWWSLAADAPYAYVQDGIGYLQGEESEVAVSGVVGSGTVTGGGAGVVWGECRLTAIASGVDDEPKSGLIMYENEGDVWQLGYNHTQRNISLQKIVGGIADAVETTAVSGVNDPNVAPLRLRLYVNSHNARSVLNDRNTVMSPSQVAAYYSDTDGVLWTKVGSNQSAGLNPNGAGFGVFSKRSIDAPVTESWAEFDYLKAAINEAHELFFASGGKDGDAQVAVWEDDLTFWHNPNTDNVIFSGILDKKLAMQPSTTANYQAVSAWEDDLYYAFDRLVYPAQRSVQTANFGAIGAWEDDLSYETDIQQNPGMVDNEVNHSQAKQAWEDQLAVTWDPSTDWTDGVTDADGKDFIQGYDFASMKYYDTTNDPWHNPTQSGFHGASREGYHYIDGRATSLYEPLATSASGIPPASWASHHQPMPGMWPGHIADFYNVTYPTTSGELRIDSTQALTGWQRSGVSSFGRWTLEGDFDVEVGFKNTSESGGSAGGIYLEVMRDWNHRVYVYRSHDNYHKSGRQYNGSYSGAATEYYNANTGKLRLTRSGSIVKAYYWSGSWNRIGGDYNIDTSNMHVVASVAGTGNWNIDTTLYNFRLNSGTVVRTAGWRRESAGTHKGSKLDFPERAYFLAGNGSLNIIDADDNKLWMRFASGNVNALYNGGDGDSGIKDMSFHDGVLWVACAGPEGHGYVHRIDFNTEDCRYSTNSTSKAFGRYRMQSGWAGWGYASAVGGIRDRHGANDFSGDHANWDLPGNRCYGISMTHDDNFAMETVAIATSGGVKVHYYNRWKFGEADGIEYHNQYANNNGAQAFWCHLDPDTKDLYWATRYHFCYASRGTYHAAWASHQYPANSALEWPERLGRWEQYHMVQYGGYFYLCTRLGVWRTIGPSGSWELAIGRPGSGAISEVLTQSCDEAVRVTLTVDGGVDLLMVGLESERHGWSQVIFVRLDTLAIYAKSQLLVGKTGQPRTMLGK